MKRASIVLIGLWALCVGCTAMKNSTSKTLFSVAEEQVIAEEFEYVYQKNSHNRSPEVNAREDIKNYLDLFINFKLKVTEAESLGLHESEAFKTELEGYRKQLAKPYLTETAVTEQLARQAYERLKEEVRAAHILISVPEEANPDDTLAAYQQAVAIRERALAGEDFNSLARQYSTDPSAADNGGDLGYFTALQMVYPFEEAAFNTPVESISQPVRTNFGYHLVNVVDRRSSLGEVKVSHIMVRAGQGISDQDSLSAHKKVNEIAKRLENGGDWDALCLQFSDDLATRSKSGSMPWLRASDLSSIPNFSETAFALKEVGDISSPLQTSFGWHIIRLDGKKGLDPYEEMEAGLKQKIAKDSRSTLSQEALVSRLKQENEFKEFSEVKNPALLALGDSTTTNIYDSTSHLPGQNLFQLKDRYYTVKALYDFVAESRKDKTQTLDANSTEKIYHEFVTQSLLNYEEEHLSEKYTDYRLLLKEYRDGILLFQLMDEKVWNKAIQDTVGLNRFFESSQEQYMWGPRAEATIYSVEQPSEMAEVKGFLEKGFYDHSFYDLAGGEIHANTRPVVDDQSAFTDVELKILNQLAVKMKQDTSLQLRVTFDPKNLQSKGKYEQLVTFLKTNNVPARRVLSEVGNNENQFIINLTCLSSKCLESALNSKGALNLKVEEGLYEKGDHPLMDQVSWKLGQIELEGLHLIHLHRMLPEMRKALKEIKGQVISDYQGKLEADWISELKKKYPVKLNENVLEKTIQRLEN